MTQKTDENLQSLLEQLERTKLTLSVAESLTSGHLQALAAREDGISKYYRGGVTPYNWQQKYKILGVDPAISVPCDCISAQVAQLMAEGVCRLFLTEIGVSTTGYASKGKSQQAYWSIHYFGKSPRKAVRSGKIGNLKLGRVEMQKEVARQVYGHLIKFLSQLEPK